MCEYIGGCVSVCCGCIVHNVTLVATSLVSAAVVVKLMDTKIKNKRSRV